MNRLLLPKRYLMYALLLIVLTLLAAPYTLPRAYATNVSATKHNLSISGPGLVKAISETRICVFCHTPHNAVSDVAGINIPLWNHTLSSAVYTVPDKTNPQWAVLLSTPQNPPDGDSKLCLSCHDGTVAIGSVVNLGGGAITISMQGTGAGGVMPAGAANLGTDLSGHHPVSIAVNNSLLTDKLQQCSTGVVSFQLCYPTTGQPVKLRPTNNTYNALPGAGNKGGVQCSSCHDPHTDPNPGTTMFLRVGDKNNTTPLCTTCHVDCSGTCP